MEEQVFRFEKKDQTLPKRYKITKKQKLEHDINIESRNLTINALVLGLASLGTVISLTSVGIESIDISQRIGAACLYLVNNSTVTRRL